MEVIHAVISDGAKQPFCFLASSEARDSASTASEEMAAHPSSSMKSWVRKTCGWINWRLSFTCARNSSITRASSNNIPGRNKSVTSLPESPSCASQRMPVSPVESFCLSVRISARTWPGEKDSAMDGLPDISFVVTICFTISLNHSRLGKRHPGGHPSFRNCFCGYQQLAGQSPLIIIYEQR